MNSVELLPKFMLAMFDGEGDGGQGDGGGGDGGGSGAGAGDGGNGGGNEGGNNGGGGGDGGSGNGAGAGNGGGNGGQARSNNNGGNGQRNNGGNGGAIRGEQGRYESAADYEARIRTLNEENQNRRQENRELRGTVTVLERRTIYGDAEKALNDAGIISPRATELFLADMAVGTKDSKLKIDGKTGKTVGLDNVAAWKTSNPELFKPAADGNGSEGGGDGGGSGDGGNNNGGAGDGNGAGAGAGNGNGNGNGQGGGQRRNSTASGASPAGGSANGGGENNGGMRDLRNLTPAERKAEIAKYVASQK